MLISTKGRYALRVMIDLAEHQTDGYIPLKEVAQRQDILHEIFCENWQNPVKQRITPHFLTTRPSNYYEFTTKE